MVAGIGVFEDPHCEIEGCVELRTDYSKLCGIHKNRMKRYGTLEVTCIA